MKTPTPEEVKNRVAVKHGYESWREMITAYNTSAKLDIDSVENEAMRDYAEALYTERIEKAGSELPDKHSINLNSSEYSSSKTYFHPFSDGDLDLAFDNGANWMKQAASLVIAKKDKGFNFLHELSLQQNELIQQKDKEIEELMKFKKLFDNHRDSIITTNTKTK